MGNWEAAERSPVLYPDAGLVMFTGFATVDSAVQSMKLGVSDYLPKPLCCDELLEVLQRALDKTLKSRRDREIERTYGEAVGPRSKF